jgi:hypothetical protein
MGKILNGAAIFYYVVSLTGVYVPAKQTTLPLDEKLKQANIDITKSFGWLVVTNTHCKCALLFSRKHFLENLKPT